MMRACSPECFYGTSVKTRAVGAFTIAERVYPSNCHTPEHIHHRPLFCVVLDGSYRERYGGNSRFCTPATLLFHAAEERHLEEFGSNGGRSLIIEIDPAWLQRLREQSAIWVGKTGAFTGGPFASLGLRLYKEFRSADQASQLAIEGLALELTAEVFRAGKNQERRPPQWLIQARELIHESSPGAMSLTGLAAAVSIHPVHLAQSFRRFFHCTVGDYARTLRIQSACREMATSDLPLAEIASRAGFADPSHFARTFKQIVGSPPSQYREAVRPGRAQAGGEAK